MNQQDIYQLKHKRMGMLAEAEALLKEGKMEEHGVKMADVAKVNGEIEACEKFLAESGRFDDGDTHKKGLFDQHQQEKEDMSAQSRVDAIRGTNEYYKGFTQAMRGGVSIKRGRGVEGLEPLYKALSESGGSPTGSDGGFLVPIDFDNMIIEAAKDYIDLSNLFHVESVTTLSGWRAVETGVATALPLVTEGGTIGATKQPKFKKVSYSVDKYGERLPVSSELLEDNTAGLLAYLARWFAPRYVMTKNSLLLALLDDATGVTLTAESTMADLKKAMITKLNTAHAKNAQILTNQNGYAALDGLLDSTGRSLLVPDPTQSGAVKLCGRPIHYADNDLIPDDTTDGFPLYVGDFKRFGTLFLRKGIEIATTDVGGDAWKNDAPELRAICRMDAQAVDTSAAFLATVADPVEADDDSSPGGN